MDMDSGMSNSTMVMMMKPYIHFTPGDILYFSTWTPTSPGTIFGACFALFIIAILERSVAAIGRVAQSKWAEIGFAHRSHKSLASVTSKTPLQGDKEAVFSREGANITSEWPAPPRRRFTPPFTVHVEIQRGILRAVGATLAYILMLAVMTFNAGFILSTIIGLGVGEILFGRFGTY